MFGAILLHACAPSQPVATLRQPVTLRIAVPQARQIDAYRGFQTVLEAQSFERLIAFDPHLRATPRLLERWTPSPDGLTWRLTIRGGVRFVDGTPFTNEDVARALRDVRTRPQARGFSVCVDDVTDVATEGARDVVVRLSRRCYNLIDDLPVQVSRTGADGTRIGTGPFQVASKSPDEMTLVANPHHYLGAPAIDRIVARPYDTLRTAWAGTMRGDVDFLQDVGPDTAEFLQDQPGVQTLTYVTPQVYAIAMNARRPFFSSPAVRYALSLAIDRRELVTRGLKGHGRPADSPVWPDAWPFDPAVPGTPFDPVRARSILASSREASVSFTCLMPAGYAVMERLALLAQRQLRAVGVEMRLEALDPQAFVARIGRGEFDAALIDPVAGMSQSVHHLFWHTPGGGGAWNLWGYSNRAVDAALDAMREASDEEQYRSGVRRFLAAIREDPPALFLAWPQKIQAVSRRFALPASAAGRDALSAVGEWQLRNEGRR